MKFKKMQKDITDAAEQPANTAAAKLDAVQERLDKVEAENKNLRDDLEKRDAVRTEDDTLLRTNVQAALDSCAILENRVGKIETNAEHDKKSMGKSAASASNSPDRKSAPLRLRRMDRIGRWISRCPNLKNDMVDVYRFAAIEIDLNRNQALCCCFAMLHSRYSVLSRSVSLLCFLPLRSDISIYSRPCDDLRPISLVYMTCSYKRCPTIAVTSDGYALTSDTVTLK